MKPKFVSPNDFDITWMDTRRRKRKCKHPKQSIRIRAKTKDRVYYICAKCLTGWHVELEDIPIEFADVINEEFWDII